MNRTFRRRVLPANWLGVVLMAFVGFYFLWHRQPLGIVAGLFASAMAVVATDRLLHTEYRLEDGKLTVTPGRFGHVQTIMLADIRNVEHVHRSWLLTNYVLIEYGERRELAVQPENENAFIEEIEKRRKIWKE